MVEMTGNVLEMAMLAMAEHGRLVCATVDTSSATGPYHSGDRGGALWASVRVNNRDRVTRLMALRRHWLPMWALREDALALNIRRAARAMGAHVDRCPRARGW